MHIVWQWNSAKDLGLLWSWSHSSWIYNYLCNQCLLPLKLWIRTPFMARWPQYIMWSSLSETCERSVVFSGYSLVSSTNKTDRHNITEILLKVALNNIHQTICQRLILFVFPIYWFWAYLKKVIPETCTKLDICFYYYNWVDTSAGGLLVPESVIFPVVSVSITGLIPLLEDY